MIIELLVNVLVGFFTFVLGLFPEGSLPTFLGNQQYLQDIWNMAAGLGAWVPWSLFGTVAAFVLGSVAIGFGIKVVRLVASYFLAGGGSAG